MNDESVVLSLSQLLTGRFDSERDEDMKDIDVLEWLTSDIVTLTHRYLARYRSGQEDGDRIQARYSACVRELLDAAELGAGELTIVERELALPV